MAQAPLPYDTIIDRGIFVSYYNLHYSSVSFVKYKLYKGGGRASRKGMNFRNTIGGAIFKYERSGYDKGHLCPAQDMAQSTARMAATFDYINCLPQTPALNRGEWKRIETRVRKMSQRDSLLIECGGLDYDTLYHQLPRLCYKIVVSLSSGDTLVNVRMVNK